MIKTIIEHKERLERIKATQQSLIKASLVLLKEKEMVRQDNSEPNLRFLLVNDEITLKEYFFRQGAEAMNIKTYEL